MTYQLSINDRFFWADIIAREQNEQFGYYDGIRSVLDNYYHMWS